MVPFNCQVEDIGQALQRVVYLVGQFVSHRRGGRRTSLLDDQSLLLLLLYRHCREVRQDLHRPGVFLIESLGPAVRHHEDRSPRFVHLPGQKYSIRNQGGANPHDVEETLADAKELRAPTLKANTTCARVTGKNGVEERRILSCCSNPVIKLLVGSIFLFDADACAIRFAENNPGVDQFLKNGIWLFDERPSYTFHAFQLQRDGMRTGTTTKQRGAGLSVYYLQAHFFKIGGILVQFSPVHSILLYQKPRLGQSVNGRLQPPRSPLGSEIRRRCSLQVYVEESVDEVGSHGNLAPAIVVHDAQGS
jgi:hypothetical protein